MAKLKSENAGLATRLAEIGRKYGEAAVDNRVLKSDVEALGAKVRKGEGGRTGSQWGGEGEG